MDNVLLAVVAALLGAISSGGLGVLDARRERRAQRRVAARTILGDLYVVEAAVELTIETGAWPDRYDWSAPIATWGETRERFAAGVKFWEWSLVDGALSNLARTVLMVRPGEKLSASDRDVVVVLRERIAAARDVVLPHTASNRELTTVDARMTEFHAGRALEAKTVVQSPDGQ